MGLLDRLFSRKEERGAIPGLGSFDGSNVTEETAIKFSAVYACVRVIAESIASLPIHVYKKKADGDRVMAGDHPVNLLVSKKPNKLYTPYSFFNTMAINAVLRGNSYAIIKRAGSMRPESLVIVQDLTPVIVEGDLFYKDQTNDKVHKASDVLHFRGYTNDGINGVSPIQTHADTIGLGLNAVKFGKSFFENGASVSGVLEHPGSLSKEAAARLKKSWNNNHQGSGKVGGTGILEEGMKYKAITIPPDQAQYIATRKFSVEDICRIFRVPPHLVSHLENATYSNIEQQSIDFVVHTLTPWLVNFEQEMNTKLFRDNETANHYVKFTTAGLLRGDSKSRGEFYKSLWNMGAVSIDEIRRWEDLNKLNDGLGELHFVPLNTQPLEKTIQDDEQ